MIQALLIAFTLVAASVSYAQKQNPLGTYQKSEQQKAQDNDSYTWALALCHSVEELTKMVPEQYLETVLNNKKSLTEIWKNGMAQVVASYEPITAGDPAAFSPKNLSVILKTERYCSRAQRTANFIQQVAAKRGGKCVDSDGNELEVAKQGPALSDGCESYYVGRNTLGRPATPEEKKAAKEYEASQESTGETPKAEQQMAPSENGRL